MEYAQTTAERDKKSCGVCKGIVFLFHYLFNILQRKIDIPNRRMNALRRLVQNLKMLYFIKLMKI